MKRKAVLVLVFTAFVVGGVSAQTSKSSFALGGGITGGMVISGVQATVEIGIGKNKTNTIAIEAGTTDIFLPQLFVSVRNYVGGQDIGYISYGGTAGLSSMLIGGTLGGGARVPLSKDKKLCLDANGKLALGFLGFAKAFSSVSLLYRF